MSHFMLTFFNLIYSKLFYLILPIALLQIFLVPGVLLNFFFRYKTNLFSLILNCFAFSLVLNYCFILILTILGLYKSYIIWIIIITEFITIILFWNNIPNYINYIFKTTKVNIEDLINKNLINKIIFFLSIFLFGMVFYTYIPFVKDETNGYLQIFELGDVIYTYSQHAISWFEGMIPSSSFLKPQLWYSNVSLIYIIFNNVYLEPFAKIIFTLIPVYIFIGLIGLSLSSKNIIFLFSGLIGLYVILTNTYAFSNSGYLEIPQILGFLIFMIFIYEELQNKVNLENKNLIYILGLILLFNCLTKEQSWIILLPTLIYFILFKKNPQNSVIKPDQIIKLALLFCIVFFPYYIYNYFYDENFKTAVRDLWGLITFDESFHNRAGHDNEFINLETRLLYAIKKYPDFLILPTIGLFLTKNKIENIFTYSFIVPYLLIWFLIMSNEIRYLYPLYLLIILFGYKNIIQIIILNIDNLLLNKKIIFTFCSFIFLLILFFNNNIQNYSEFINSISNKKINNLTDPEDIKPKFNKAIVDYFSYLEIKPNDKILTNYYALKYLNIPALSKIQKKIEYSNLEDFEKLGKTNYLIIFKNCEEFYIKYSDKLKLKKIEKKNNSCIFSNF